MLIINLFTTDVFSTVSTVYFSIPANHRIKGTGSVYILFLQFSRRQIKLHCMHSVAYLTTILAQHIDLRADCSCDYPIGYNSGAKI